MQVEVTQADRGAAASVAVLVEMRELILAGRADHHAEPFARHRLAERAKIVAWLRDEDDKRKHMDNFAGFYARRIEAGEHDQ